MIITVIADHNHIISNLYFWDAQAESLGSRKREEEERWNIFRGLFSSLRETACEGRQKKVAAPLRVVRATRRGREAGEGRRQRER